MSMERNKWEEEFKEKLNQREISPTPHAWDRLDAMLNESDSKTAPVTANEKGVRKLAWLYIAAGIAALLMVATFYFKADKTAQTNEVVERPQQEPIKSIQQPEIAPDQIQNREQIAEVEATPEHTPTPRVKRTGAVGQLVSNNSQIAQVSLHKPATSHQHPATNHQQPTTNNQLPATSHQISTHPNSTPDQIASVEPDIPQPKSVQVDPKSLLSQVDGELELTFRDKAIKTINKKFKNVKVALANRNNQE